MSEQYNIPTPAYQAIKQAFTIQEQALFRDGVRQAKLTIAQSQVGQEAISVAKQATSGFQAQANPYIRGVKTIINKQSPTNPYDGKIGYTSPGDPELYKSALGTPVLADITFSGVTYTDDAGNVITTPTMTFQAIIVTVSMPRNIVKTEIQGRNRTVKEYIGEGDEMLTFKGIITGTNGQYPIDEVNALKRIIKAPVAIPVVSAFLQNLDIDSVVFEDRTLDQEEGGYSYQTFSLNAISDTPQELIIVGM